jgi:serine phosphatase RsbU (regulator of sigma subunit)
MENLRKNTLDFSILNEIFCMSKHNRYRGYAVSGECQLSSKPYDNVEDMVKRIRDAMTRKIEQNDKRLLRVYQRLYKYTDEIVFVLNEDGEILETNMKVDSFFPEKIVGRNIESLFEGIELSLTSLFESEVIQSVIARSRSRDKRKYAFLLSFIPISINSENSEIMVIGKDLSEIEGFREQVESLHSRVHKLEEEKKLTGMAKNGKNKALALTSTLKKLERTKEELEKINLTLTKELELAATLQKSLIPHKLPDDRYLQFAFHYEPMQLVGGDYYDVMDLGDGKKGLIVADVSGHGVSSAFIAAMLKISFLNYAQMLHSPASVLTKLNEEYCQLIQTGDFVTVFYAVIDPPKNRMTYCGAGHPRPLFLHRKSSTIELLSSEGFFIGMFDQAEYMDKVVEMQRGDRFMVFTDGINEAYSDERGEQFGEKRLLECFQDCSDEPIDSVIKNIIDHVKNFMKKSIFYDDLAIVAVEYK